MPRLFFIDFPTAAMSVSPFITAELLLFSSLGAKEWSKCKSVSSLRLLPAWTWARRPVNQVNQIIASTTKRQGQFRNRFREIGESSGRRHVHFYAVTSVHEHNTYSIKERLKKRALHVHVKDWIFADEQPVEPGNLKTTGTSGDGRNGFLRLPVVFPSLCCKAPLVWWIRPKWQRSNTPVVCKTLSQSLFG